MRYISTAVLLYGLLYGLVYGLPFPASADTGTPVGTGTPVAIVEDIAAPSTKLRVMDYLVEGATIVLGKGESVTIAYFRSCAIEHITGGVVTVGARESRIAGGKATMRFVECGGGAMVLSGREAVQSAVAVVRAPKPDADTPTVTVNALAPIFVFSRPAAELVIERLDRTPADRRHIEIDGRGLDLAAAGIRLDRGGVYRATAGSASVVFKVAETARDGQRTIIGRLIGL